MVNDVRSFSDDEVNVIASFLQDALDEADSDDRELIQDFIDALDNADGLVFD